MFFHSEQPKLYGVLAIMSAMGLTDLVSWTFVFFVFQVSKHQISNSKHSIHQISKESAELKNDCLPESFNLPPNCKDYQVHVKMRRSKEEKNPSLAAYLAVSTGLFCLLMVSAVVWFGRTGIVRKSSDDPAVLKIMVPSKTHVSKYTKFTECLHPAGT